KWLARGVAASAKRNRFAATKAVLFSFHVDEFDFPLDAQGPIIADRDFRWWHLCSYFAAGRPGHARAFTGRVGPGFFCQYFGIRGSTSSAHARTPPFRCKSFLKPAVCKKWMASAERFPLPRRTTISTGM